MTPDETAESAWFADPWIHWRTRATGTLWPPYTECVYRERNGTITCGVGYWRDASGRHDHGVMYGHRPVEEA